MKLHSWNAWLGAKHLNLALLVVCNLTVVFAAYSTDMISPSPKRIVLQPPPPVEYFDLGYELIQGETIFFPGQRYDYTLFEDVKGANVTEDNKRLWLAMFSFCMGEHGGTHVDAPYHYNEFGWKLGEIPVNRMMNVRAAIVDVEANVFAFPNPQDFVVDLPYFLEHERRFGQIPLGSVVFVHTGWERFWPDKKKYLGTKSDGTLNFPGISERAAQFLVNERKIVGIGIDTNSIDIGNVKGGLQGSVAHYVLTGNNVYVIENVANLGRLLQRIRPNGLSAISSFPVPTIDSCDLHVTVLPIKSRGTGGPARVIAHCNN